MNLIKFDKAVSVVVPFNYIRPVVPPRPPNQFVAVSVVPIAHKYTPITHNSRKFFKRTNDALMYAGLLLTTDNVKSVVQVFHFREGAWRFTCDFQIFAY